MNESNNNHNETCNKQTFNKLTCDKETKLLYNNSADVDKTTIFEGMKNNSNNECDKIAIENEMTFNKKLETKTSKTPKDPDVTFYDPWVPYLNQTHSVSLIKGHQGKGLYQRMK